MIFFHCRSHKLSNLFISSFPNIEQARTIIVALITFYHAKFWPVMIVTTTGVGSMQSAAPKSTTHNERHDEQADSAKNDKRAQLAGTHTPQSPGTACCKRHNIQ
jgi:hypothetical protein